MNQPSSNALEAPTSPDQLDQLMQVTPPRGWIALAGVGVLLTLALIWGLTGSVQVSVEGEGVLLSQGGVQILKATEPGIVTRILVGSGETVEKGKTLIELAPAKDGASPTRIVSEGKARCLERIAREGDRVTPTTELLVLEPLDKPLQVRLFLSTASGYQVQAGMPVQVWPAHAKESDYGYLLGKVTDAAKFPISRQEMQRRLQNEDLVRQFSDQGPMLQILIRLEADPASTNGYRWSLPNGQRALLASGMPCHARIILDQQRAAPTSAAANVNAWKSPGPWSRILRSSFSTRPPVRSTPSLRNRSTKTCADAVVPASWWPIA
jgi:hypothetical protein